MVFNALDARGREFGDSISDLLTRILASPNAIVNLISCEKPEIRIR